MTASTRRPAANTLLIVEDDEGLRSSLQRSFRRRNREVFSASSVDGALGLLRARRIDLLLLDMRLPDGSGLEVLKAARDLDDDIAVIMMTAFPEVKTAVQAMKEGACDFIVKPFELEEIQLTVERATENRELRREVRRLDRERKIREDESEMLGDSPAIEQVRAQVRRVAGADIAVLIVGETGTGKELVADSLHRLSARAEYPMVKVNCSAVTDPLLESELFGHEKGAYTDAKEARPGLFEMADGGTLFLDEIAEMKPQLQAKLLRVIEGEPFRRVGGTREIRTNVRVIAATNRDLPVRIQSHLFREDLYYRLNAFQIVVPPLRDRGSDVVLLARFFLQRSAATLRKRPLRVTPSAEDTLLTYSWPGNARELRNVMERAAILCEAGEVADEHLPRELHASAFVQRHAAKGSGPLPSLDEVAHRYVQLVLRSADDNISEAARILGVSRNTLKARLRSS